MKYDLDKIASYLIESVPGFSDGTLALYTGVNAASIMKNGTPITVQKEQDGFHLLVCREDQIVLGIYLNDPAEEVNDAYLKMLPSVRMPEDDYVLPFDESPRDEPSPEWMQSLCEQVSRKLSALNRTTESLSSYRRRVLGMEPKGGTLKYTLPAVPLEEVLTKAGIGQDKAMAMLIQKRFLRKSTMPTDYGKEKGLFLSYRMEVSGAIRREIMTTVCMAQTLLDALCWKPEKQNCRSLRERIKILQEPTVSGGEYAVPVLKELLNSRVERMFQNRPASLQKLNEVLDRAAYYLEDSGCTSVGEKKSTTYQNCVELTRTLWEQLGNDPRYDSTQTAALRRCCEQLLLLLAEPFLIEQPQVVPADKPKRKQRLRKRIGSVQTEFPVARIPAMHYYYAAACMTGSDYPNWPYKRKICPLFEGDDRPESAFELRILAQHGHNLHENKAVEDWKETYPLLFSLLVDPIVGEP